MAAVLLRRCAVLLTLALAAGCGGPTPSPGGRCEPPGLTPIVDEGHGFSICLPGHWRDLRPGDPGWVEVYEGPGLETEQKVATGTIKHFAVPLRPRDADLVVNLVIYVEDNARGVSTADAGEAYLETGRAAEGTDLELSIVTLPVGEVAELTGNIPNDISDLPSTDWFDAFVLATPETVYYVVFRCDLESRATYEGQFQEIASTFTLIPNAPPSS